MDDSHGENISFFAAFCSNLCYDFPVKDSETFPRFTSWYVNVRYTLVVWFVFHDTVQRCRHSDGFGVPQLKMIGPSQWLLNVCRLVGPFYQFYLRLQKCGC